MLSSLPAGEEEVLDLRPVWLQVDWTEMQGSEKMCCGLAAFRVCGLVASRVSGVSLRASVVLSCLAHREAVLLKALASSDAVITSPVDAAVQQRGASEFCTWPFFVRARKVRWIW